MAVLAFPRPANPATKSVMSTTGSKRIPIWLAIGNSPKHQVGWIVVKEDATEADCSIAVAAFLRTVAREFEDGDRTGGLVSHDLVTEADGPLPTRDPSG